METEDHVFWYCKDNSALRDSIAESAWTLTKNYLTKEHVSEDLTGSLSDYAYSTLRHWGWWRGDALHGRPPELAQLSHRVGIGLEHLWHSVLIIGAARIWGARMRAWGTRQRALTKRKS